MIFPLDIIAEAWKITAYNIALKTALFVNMYTSILLMVEKVEC